MSLCWEETEDESASKMQMQMQMQIQEGKDVSTVDKLSSRMEKVGKAKLVQ